MCGFTAGKPWLPIGDANEAVNVEASRTDPGSMLALYRRLLQLRRAEPVLVSGRLAEIVADDSVLQFIRSDGKKLFRVVVNLAEEARQIEVEAGVIVGCTELSRKGESVRGAVEIQSAEAMIIEVQG